ncbi:hypothetical protein HX774_16125, partial [Brevundimonas sp. P7753]|nr:hypothetical protein [Brevundimonas sp. P7753]
MARSPSTPSPKPVHVPGQSAGQNPGMQEMAAPFVQDGPRGRGGKAMPMFAPVAGPTARA